MNPPIRRTDLQVAAFFVLLATLFYLPQLFALRTFPDGDFTHHFLPFSLFQQRELLAGRLPLWNPYTYSGHPFLADVQAAVFYPVSNLLILISLPFRALGSEAGVRLYFLQVEAALHVALAGFFVYLLVRDLTGQRIAALLAGCTFAFSGYLTGYPPLQLAVLRTGVWLPLILWLLLRAFTRPQRWATWTGAGVALAVAFLAGHPQTFLHMGYVVAAWCLWCAWLLREEDGRWLCWVAGLLVFATVAVGTSAAQWIPSVEFARLSVRAATDYAFVSGGLPLRDTWQLLLPGVLTQFSPLYVGVIGVGLAVCALGVVGRTEAAARPAAPVPLRAVVLFFSAIALIGLLLSYGGNGFLFPVFYRFAPGWDLFRGQERAASVVALGLSVLAGCGLAALPVLPLRRRRLLVAIASALIIIGVYAFGLLWQLPGRSAIGQWRYLAVALLTLLCAMVWAVPLWWEGWNSRRSQWLVALTLVNLFLANMATNVTVFGPQRKTILAPEMEALAAAVAEREGENVGLPGRVYNEFRIYEDYGMRQEIEDAWGSSPLRLARYAALFEEFPLDRMWRLTGVDHVLTWRHDLFEPSDLLAEFPQSADTTYLHRLQEPNPRAWVVTGVQSVADDEALALLADHEFDVDRMALVPPNVTVELPAEEAGETFVRLDRTAPNALRVDVESEISGLLVISENWMPGWRIRNVVTDGNPSEPLPIHRTDLTLIGVPVPGGHTTFELIYWPDSVRIGLAISGGTLLLLIGFGVVRWRRERGA